MKQREYSLIFPHLRIFRHYDSICQLSTVQGESESDVRLSETPWTIQSMEFSRPEYWTG